MVLTEAKIEALSQIWGWATFLCEGIEDGIFEQFSDNMAMDIEMGRYTKDEAKLVQMEIYKESERILKRRRHLMNKLNQLTKQNESNQ